MPPHIVLVAERGAGAEREIAPRPAETPDHRSCAAVNLVDGRRVPRRDQQVPVGVDPDRVQVEVVDVTVGREGELGRLLERDVIEAVPLEQDASSRDIDLLDDPLDQASVDRAADAREIGTDLVVDRDQGRVARRDHELV